MTDLHQHCLEVAEKMLPCNCASESNGNRHLRCCPMSHREGVAAALETELRAERERVLEEAVSAVDTAYSRNTSSEDWHSRAVNCIRALKGTGK
jgi:hypothetical protein